MLTPDSVMAPYRGLFNAPGDAIKIVDDGAGNRTLEKTPFTEALFDFDSEQTISLTPNADGLLFVPLARARARTPVILTPNEEFTGEAVAIAAETPDLQALVAYVQKLGMNRGKWRDLFEPQQMEVIDAHAAALRGMDRPRQGGLRAALPRLPRRDRRRQRARGDLHVQSAPAQLQRGGVQVQADQGAAADRRRPAAHDHARRARHGDAGLARTADQRPARRHPVHQVRAGGRPRPIRPRPTRSSSRSRPARRSSSESRRRRPRQIIERGKEIWTAAKCWECHGQGGKGDGEKAAGLKDDLGLPDHPRRSDQRPVQVGRDGGGHLPHDLDRA